MQKQFCGYVDTNSEPPLAIGACFDFYLPVEQSLAIANIIAFANCLALVLPMRCGLPGASRLRESLLDPLVRTVMESAV